MDESEDEDEAKGEAKAQAEAEGRQPVELVAKDNKAASVVIDERSQPLVHRNLVVLHLRE